jgi:hypothetical protein
MRRIFVYQSRQPFTVGQCGSACSVMNQVERSGVGCEAPTLGDLDELFGGDSDMGDQVGVYYAASLFNDGDRDISWAIRGTWPWSLTGSSKVELMSRRSTDQSWGSRHGSN